MTDYWNRQDRAELDLDEDDTNEQLVAKIKARLARLDREASERKREREEAEREHAEQLKQLAERTERERLNTAARVPDYTPRVMWRAIIAVRSQFTSVSPATGDAIVLLRREHATAVARL